MSRANVELVTFFFGNRAALGLVLCSSFVIRGGPLLVLEDASLLMMDRAEESGSSSSRERVRRVCLVKEDWVWVNWVRAALNVSEAVGVDGMVSAGSSSEIASARVRLRAVRRGGRRVDIEKAIWAVRRACMLALLSPTCTGGGPGLKLGGRPVRVTMSRVAWSNE